MGREVEVAAADEGGDRNVVGAVVVGELAEPGASQSKVERACQRSSFDEKGAAG